MTNSVEINGALGEGGGQVLRTSLALAMITGRTLRLRRIRAGRAKPGLRRQHLACVEAAAQLCHARVRGATLGSQDLELIPGPITGGELAIDIGTAGSTTLVVQTILVPALAAGVALRAVIQGGTHNPLAPPFDFLDRVYLPHLRAMGAEVTLTLDRHGFASGRAPRAAAKPRSDRDRRVTGAASDDDDGGDPTWPRPRRPATPPSDDDDGGDPTWPRPRRPAGPPSDDDDGGDATWPRPHRPAGPPSDDDDDDGGDATWPRPHRPAGPPSGPAAPRQASADPAAPRQASADPAAPRQASADPAAPRQASADPAAPRQGPPSGDATAGRPGAGRPHGQLTLTIGPGARLRPIEVIAAGPITARHATAILARLPSHVADRELAVVQRDLGFAPTDCEVRQVDAPGPGNVLLLEVERAEGRELVAAFGEPGLRAELVAQRACAELAAFLAAGVPVGGHLADQLLLPLAVAGGGQLRAAPLSRHATTNIETIRRFLDVAITIQRDGDSELVTLR
jgi:RNA 3'-terminal phosphate cyclase